MKNTLKFVAVSLITVVAFDACTPPPPPSSHFLSAGSSTMSSFYTTGVTAGGASGAKVSISGVSGSGASFTVWINPYAGTTGTIAMSDSTAGTLYSSAAGDTTISSAHGTMTLTSVTPNLIGTFTATGRDASAISGSFNVVAP